MWPSRSFGTTGTCPDGQDGGEQGGEEGNYHFPSPIHVPGTRKGVRCVNSSFQEPSEVCTFPRSSHGEEGIVHFVQPVSPVLTTVLDLWQALTAYLSNE